MIKGANIGLQEQIAAAFGWWREAGVDCDLQDAPQGWLAAPAPQQANDEAPPPALQVAAAPPPPPELPKPDRSTWPQSLDAFAPWWKESDWLDHAPPEARVAPRGISSAELFVLVGEPEREDGEVLLSGPQGRLLDAMLAAMGLVDAQVYRASVLPRATPHADWAALAARGLGELACHHIALAAPKRVLALGSHILPLLGHDPANNLPLLTEINHGSGNIPMLAARDLAVLLERPRWKAGLWQSWLDWTRDSL